MWNRVLTVMKSVTTPNCPELEHCSSPSV